MPFPGKLRSSAILVVGIDPYWCSKTLESIHGDDPFREAGTRVFCPYVNYIPTHPFEYEYRFTENAYEKHQLHKSTATIIAEDPLKTSRPIRMNRNFQIVSFATIRLLP